VLHFESQIEAAVLGFSGSLPGGSRVLDAGAGESQYAHLFTNHRYLAVDLAVGDPRWNYRKLDAIADLSALPLATASCDAALNIVTLEHVREPAAVLREIARALKPGGRLLLVVPHEWEVHQAPHDYYRYTRYGVDYLLEQAGFTERSIQPVGGFFRLLGRRMLNAVQFFPKPLFVPAALLLGPPALIAPLFDFLDRERNFTLGYICTARKA
jgi:SAM-dependent methyltransferase